MEVLKPPPNGAPSSGEDPLALYDVERPVPAGRPWLVANMVAGLDGSLAWHGRVGSLSSPTDRDLFLRLRAVADGVLVGASTVREEGYGPVRLPEDRRARRGGRGDPPIVVVTRSLALDWEAPLFTEPGDARTVVVTCASAPADAAERAREVAEVVVAGDERVDPVVAMAELRARGMEVVLTEGGPTLLAELVDHALLDELCLTLTPYLGGDPLTMAHRPEAARGLVPFALASVLHHEGELFLRYLASGAEGGAS